MNPYHCMISLKQDAQALAFAALAGGLGLALAPRFLFKFDGALGARLAQHGDLWPRQEPRRLEPPARLPAPDRGAVEGHALVSDLIALMSPPDPEENDR